MERSGEDLFTLRRDVVCVKCESKGAVQYYGRYFEKGMGETGIKSFEKYIDQPYLSPAMGFGGTIPFECLNCENQGLIDFGGLEGYKRAFRTIKEKTPKKKDTDGKGNGGLQMF